jgi:hypothetical protein
MNPAITAAAQRFSPDAFLTKEPPPSAPEHASAPEPTRSTDVNARLIAPSAGRRFDAVTLNPQPLPPKEAELNARLSPSLFVRFDAVALNPQPLPPREIASAFQPIGKALSDDWCGTVPRRPHFPPPPPGPWSELISQVLVSR